MADARGHSYYEDYWRQGWTTSPPRKLLDLLERYVQSTARCLDVGCGDGGTSGVWLSHHAAEYVGVDISEAAIRMARKRGLDARRIEDAADLPFPNGSFDLAVCIEVLEHLFEPQRILQAIQRVVGPAGMTIITVPNVAHWRSRLDLALLGRWNPRGDQISGRQPWRDPHVRFFTLRSLCRLVDACGFEIVEKGGHDEHGFVSHIPVIRELGRTRWAGRTTSRSSRFLPGVFAANIYVVARAR